MFHGYKSQRAFAEAWDLSLGTVEKQLKRGWCKWPQRKVRGQSKHYLFRTWEGMIERCYMPNHTEYYRYGALGVQVCVEWRTDFWQFVKDMGERPARHSLDRINPFGDYEPDNCRWASYKIQARNTRKNFKQIKGDE